MAIPRTYAIVALALAGQISAPGQALKADELRERAKAGRTTRVSISLKAEGEWTPGQPPGSKAEAPPKPMALKVETSLEYAEKLLSVDDNGVPSRSARRIGRAAVAVNGEVRPFALALRPELTTLVADRREQGVTVFSPAGPLSRRELELIQGPGDSLTLAGLLPIKAVGKGDRWTVSDSFARSISGYDALASNTLEATLESIDAETARIALVGDVRGASLGGEGSMALHGTAVFDRAGGFVRQLKVERAEVRKAGQVENGLDMKSSLDVRQQTADAPPELADDAIKGLEVPIDPAFERLTLDLPGGRAGAEVDRDWHIAWDDDRRVVLKRLDHGELVAQCNISKGPEAGRGRHQDPSQFRDDIRKALGGRFVQFLGAGEVEGAPPGEFRYKVAAQGREGDVGVIWYYYLIADAEGAQLLATFTLGEAQSKSFGDQDMRLIESIRWGVRKPQPDR
ncbi:hypothetical protein EP7_000235 [Isosphaeraceae bacterium EP7]